MLRCQEQAPRRTDDRLQRHGGAATAACECDIYCPFHISLLLNFWQYFRYLNDYQNETFTDYFNVLDKL